MESRVRQLICCLAVVLLAACSQTRVPVTEPGFDLDYSRLSGPLGALAQTERDTVRDTIELIKKGEHTLALNRLTALKDKNPENSSLHIMASYALLQAGNLAGAFEEAEAAHETRDGNGAYRCWFLGKVASITGNKDVLEREIAHLRRSGEMVAQLRELEEEIMRE